MSDAAVVEVAQRIRVARQVLNFFGDPLSASDVLEQALALLEQRLVEFDAELVELAGMALEVRAARVRYEEREAEVEPWGILGEESGAPIVRPARGTPTPDDEVTVPGTRHARETNRLEHADVAAGEWGQAL